MPGIKGIEDKNDFVNNWSTAYVGASWRLIIWIESTDDKIDLVNNWWAFIRSF